MLAFALLVVPMIYIASFGPYVWLSKSGNLNGQSKSIASNCFQPLLRISAKWSPTESALMWYYGKWSDLAVPKNKQPKVFSPDHISIKTVPDFSKRVPEKITMLGGTTS